ncbi:MAG: ATP synthase F1 subunit epsilon [Vulcanimicrobiaceae bacterium]
MANTLPFKLITPTSIVFEGPAELVIAVGTDGEEGILPSHAPFLTTLKPGILRANVVVGDERRRLVYATSEGFMQALPDRVTVIVDAAVDADHVDPTAVRSELNDAEARQRGHMPESPEYAREQAIIDFANARLTLIQ